MIHLENEELSDLINEKLNRTEKISLINKEYEKWIFNQIPQKINSRKPKKLPNHVERIQRKNNSQTENNCRTFQK